MDFGLAKPLGGQAAGTGSGSTPPSFTAMATMSGPSPLSPLTTAGSIIGTIQYMSPEQIEGKEADARSDIFAFGAVLYEMATGKRPFSGKSQISLASSILESDPEPVSGIKPQTPLGFEHVVTTCLSKNPEERYLAAHDIKLELQWIAAERPAPAVAAQVAATGSREWMGWIAGVIFALIVGAAAGMLLYHPAQTVHGIRAVINPPEKTALNLTGDSAGPPVLAPDGSAIAFAATGADGKTELWVRQMNGSEARLLAGTEGGIFPFWAPDSRSLGFFADGKVKTIDLGGDSEQVVCEATLGRGGAWGPGGVILFSANPTSPMMRVSTSGGTPEAITKIDTAQHTSHRWPFFLPDGKHFLYLALHHDPSKSANNTLYYASLDGKENRPLFRSQSNAIYAGGFLMFGRGDQLMAQPFDPDSGKLKGESRPMVKGVMNDASTWHMDASASDDGLLVFGAGASGDLQLVWLDPGTKEVSTLADKITGFQGAVLSPQGDRIALQIDSGENDIWVLDLARNVRTRLTFGPVANLDPVWSPDGKWIAYTSARDGKFFLCRKPSDGSGNEEVLLSDDQQILVSDWSRDGKSLIYSRPLPGGPNRQTWGLHLEGDRKPSLVLERGGAAQLSPDGRWLAYLSGESGALEVYVVPFGSGQGKWQVSAHGATGRPRWSKDAKQLYYLDPTYNLFSVPVKDAGGALQLGTPEKLVSNWSAPQVFFDVTPDGKKILLDRVSQQVGQSLTVVTNFAAGLKK
jgi:Tol biopolymer transport system component